MKLLLLDLQVSHLELVLNGRALCALNALAFLRLGRNFLLLDLNHGGLGIRLLLLDLHHRLRVLDLWRGLLLERGGRHHELLRVRPTHCLQGGGVDGDGVVEARVALLELLQAHDLHHALAVAGRVRVGLRHKLAVVERREERRLIPRICGLLVALPEAFRILLKAAGQKLKLLRLRRMHPLVDRVQDLGGLVDHGQRRAHRRVGAALAHLHLGRAADPHAGLGHVADEVHQRRAGLLVGERHDRLLDRHAAGLHQCAAAGRDAEDVGVLPGAGVRHEEAGEVGVHARVQHFAPRRRDGVGGVAENVEQADVVEAEAGHEGVLDEVRARLGKLGLVLVVVADNGQDFAGGQVDGHAVGDLQPALLALVLVLEAGDVQLAVDLVYLAVAVLGAEAARRDPLLGPLLALRRVEVGVLRGGQVNVAVDAEDLEAPDCGRSHH